MVGNMGLGRRRAGAAHAPAQRGNCRGYRRLSLARFANGDVEMLQVTTAVGVANVIPRPLRVVYLAGYTAVAALLGVALVQRLWMRLLLNYHGWMYESKPSMMTMVWGLCLRGFFLGQRQPLLYSFQNAMPRQPVPALKDTLEKYLRSVKPLLSKEDYDEAEGEGKRFIEGEGIKLQGLLVLKSWFAANYVSDWWEKYVYLRSRSSILINSNYYGLGYANYIPSHCQAARAAVLTHFYTKCKQQLDSEQIKPMTIRDTVPICMRQYERVFCTTRVPGRDSDVVLHGDSSHIVVLHKGTFWRLNVISDEGYAISPAKLQRQLEYIMELSAGKVPNKAEAGLPALTALDRTRWAEVREEHLQIGINRLSLEEIESAIFVLCLDDRTPSNWTEMGELSLHGFGDTRWCDKSFNLLVYANGDAAVHAEHSWADAPVIAHMWEWVLCHENITQPYAPSGQLLADAFADLKSPPPSPTKALQSKGKYAAKAESGPVQLEWQLSQEAEAAVQEARVLALRECENLFLRVGCYGTATGGYGKGFVKKQKCGPDAWIQMALQLAYFRDQGFLSLTYEAAAVRLFNEGRTETIRSVSVESKNFVDAMANPNSSKEERISALRAAAAQHQKTSRDSGGGRGCDRHLFALYVAGKGIGKDVEFLKRALSIPYKLSTSQIPQTQTDFKRVRVEGVDLVSPSGGFGPVADDGYGVSYMIADEDRTFFHVSSKRSAGNTDSERFYGQIEHALDDMRELFQPGPAHKSAISKSTGL